MTFDTAFFVVYPETKQMVQSWHNHGPEPFIFLFEDLPLEQKRANPLMQNRDSSPDLSETEIRHHKETDFCVSLHLFCLACEHFELISCFLCDLPLMQWDQNEEFWLQHWEVGDDNKCPKANYHPQRIQDENSSHNLQSQSRKTKMQFSI